MAHHFFGKYRGTVLDNIDPLMLGRILAQVPAVPGMIPTFAMPCVPYAGPNVGFYAIPPVGANVWIEFEAGDPNYPIWSGCFWGTGELPGLATASTPQTQVFQTDSVSMVFSGLADGGGFSLTCNPVGAAGPLTLRCNAEGCVLNYAGNSINLTQDTIGLSIGSTTVSMNTAEISVATTELQVAASAAIVEAGMVEVQGTVNLEGAFLVEGPTIMVGGLNLTGGGTVDGAPLA